MKAERIIFKNTLLLSAGKAFGDTCTFFFLIYFARTFGSELLGKYAFAMSLCGFLTIFMGLGLNTYAIREISRDKERTVPYIGHLIVTRAIFSLPVFSIIVLCGFASGFTSDMIMILILIGLFQIFTMLTGSIKSGFIAHQQMHYPAFLESYHKLFILVLGSGCIIVFNNPIMALTVYPFSALTMFALGFFIFIKNYGLPKLNFDAMAMKQSITKARPFFLLIILAQFFDRIGIILLTYLKGDVDTGIYSASDRLMVAIISFVGMFAMSLFPVMSELHVTSKDKLLRLCERFLRVMLVVLFPISITIFFMSKQIILLVYGVSFIESAKVLKIICWSTVFIAFSSILSNLLIASNHQKALVKIRCTIYAGYFLLSLILISRYSYSGLAIARVGAIAITFFATCCYTYRIYHLHIFKLFIAPLISLLVSLLVYFALEGLNFWINLLCVLVSYGCGMILLKGIALNDFVFLKNIIFGRKMNKGDTD